MDRGLPIRDVVSVRHLLEDGGADDRLCNDAVRMAASDDWVRFVLARPVVEPPGSRFVYNTGAVHLLAPILQRATGLDPADFAERHLFGPLGIEEVRWVRPSNASPPLPLLGGGLSLAARDMAKMGQLLADEGRWMGRSVVQAAWIQGILDAARPATLQDGYGRLWWFRAGAPTASGGWRPDTWFARGSGGHHLFVLPALELVVAFQPQEPAEGLRAFEYLARVVDALDAG